MTKAQTVGEKRRRRKAASASESAVERLCAITGVRVSAGAKEPPEADPAALAQANTCARMGWPFDDRHRAMCRDMRMGTLYGRLTMLSRLHDDARAGIAEWARLDRALSKALGSEVPGYDFRSGDGEPDLPAIRRARDEAWSVLIREGQAKAQLVQAVVANETAYPSEWPGAYDAALELAGFALARHFGLRL